MRLGLGHGLDVGYRSELFGATSYLLDAYTGAAAAYSLRQLQADVTSVVRVVRSSDSAEADFTAAEVLDGTLAAWVGANNGLLKTWYDQSGNAKHISQSVQANMPIIVSSGSLVLVNGLPAVDFNGTSHQLKTSPLSLDGDTSFSAIALVKNDGGDGVIFANDVVANSYFFGLTSNASNQHGGFLASSTSGGIIGFSGTASTSQLLMYADFLQSSVSYYENGSLQSGTSGYVSLEPSSFDVGARFTGSALYDGKIQEIVIWSASKAGNRSDILSEVNTYYSIY